MNNHDRLVLLCSSTTVSAIVIPTTRRQLTDIPEGTTEYTTCDSLLNTSGGDWPQSSVFEIAAAGVDLNKLVIGKPAQAAGDANSGYIAPATLVTCISDAHARGWSEYCRLAVMCVLSDRLLATDAGVMVWEVSLLLASSRSMYEFG